MLIITIKASRASQDTVILGTRSNETIIKALENYVVAGTDATMVTEACELLKLMGVKY
jgi:hypothetical protein